MPPCGKTKRHKKEEAIVALLHGRTIQEAALDCGLGYRTLKTWMASEWFRTAYRAAKRQLLDSTINQLRAVSGQGVAVLQEIANNPDSPATARVSAARAIVELTLKAVEIQDILERLESLEAAMMKGDD